MSHQIAALTLVAASACSAPTGDGPAPVAVDELRFPPFTQSIPGSPSPMDFVPVAREDGSVFFAATTEVTWDAFDAFVFGLDGVTADPQLDALARPSKPYINVDRGFGHRGFPALSVSRKSAAAFCDWLSLHTGRPFRLPSVDEWKALALAPQVGDQFAEISDQRTRAVGTGTANAWGIHDAYGNTAEWVLLPEGKSALAGGSFLHAARDSGADTLLHPTPAWNQTDPQIPKSVWWLADAAFAGFRVVCDDEGLAGEGFDGEGFDGEQ